MGDKKTKKPKLYSYFYMDYNFWIYIAVCWSTIIMFFALFMYNPLHLVWAIPGAIVSMLYAIFQELYQIRRKLFDTKGGKK